MALLFGSKLLMAPNLELPWSSSVEEDSRFWRLFGILLIPFFILSIAIPFINVPEPTREELEVLPPVLAKLKIEEKKLPPPPPPPEPEPEKKEPEPEEKEPEPEPEPEPEKKPEPEPEPVKKKPEPVKLEVARQQAQAKINQFANELADLSDMVDVEDIKTTALNNSDADTQVARVERDFISSGAKSKSGGINTASLSKNTGKGVALQGKESTSVKSKLEDVSAIAGAERKQTRDKTFRGDQDIRKKMDAAKGRIFKIYQRALRDDPTLQGTVTFELVIEPNGSVSSAKIISSELNDEALHRKLLAKIRGINFGASNVLKTTLNYSFNFLPY